MGDHKPLRILGATFVFSFLLSLGLTVQDFAVSKVLLDQSFLRALLLFFPSIQLALSEGLVISYQVLVFAVQWILVPIETVLLIIFVRWKSGMPHEAPSFTFGEWAGMVIVWSASVGWVLGSLSILDFPTFINGALLFSKYAAAPIVRGVEYPFGLTVISWLSAWCESTMFFFFLMFPIALFRYRFWRQLKSN